MTKYEIAQTAYVKLALHALKHRACAVDGVLVGSAQNAEDAADGVVEIVDAVPLFHGSLGLLPMLELALTQIEEHFSRRQGLTIVGYYHANERVDDYELNGISRKIGEHIARYFQPACILLLDNRLLETIAKGGNKKPALQLFTREAARGWRQCTNELALKEVTANNLLYDYILEGRQESVIDFEEHLDDITKDWLNPHLFD